MYIPLQKVIEENKQLKTQLQQLKAEAALQNICVNMHPHTHTHTHNLVCLLLDIQADGEEGNKRGSTILQGRCDESFD